MPATTPFHYSVEVEETGNGVGLGKTVLGPFREELGELALRHAHDARRGRDGAVAISFILAVGKDTVVNQQALVALAAAGASIIMAYVFGATWDDKSKRDALAAAAVPPPAAEE